MNINLMIDNILLPNAGVALSRTTIALQQSADQFNPASVDNPPFDDTPQTITADNNPVTIPAEPSSEETQQFQQVLGKRVSPEAPRELQENKKSCISNKGPMPGAFSMNNIIYPLLGQIAQKSAIDDIVSSYEGTTKEIVSSQLTQQSLVGLKTANLPNVTGPVVKTVKNNPILTPQKVLQKPEPIPGGLQTRSSASGEPPTDTSGGQLTTDVQSLPAADATENGNKSIPAVLVSKGQTIIVGKGKSVTVGNGQAITVGNGKTADGEMPVANDSPNATDQANTLSLLQSEKPMPEASGDDKAAVLAEKLVMTGKPVMTDGQEKPVLQQDVVVNVEIQKNGETTDPQLVDNEKSTPPNKAEIGLNDQIMMELSDGSNKDSQSTADNSTGQFVLKDLNPEQVNITTSQTKDDTGSDSNFEQVISVNNVQGDIAEQTSATTATQRTDGNADMTTDIGEQIQSAVLQAPSRQGEKQITIHLDPPELGKVYMKFEQQDEQIIGLLEVEKLQTKIELQQLLPQIVKNLNDSGITVKKLEVTLTNEQQQAYRDQSLTSGQDGWSGQQDSENPGNQADNKSYYEWLTSTFGDSYTGFAQPQEMLITGSSINMLV